MDGAMAVVAERLAVDHPEAAPTDVGRVVADCADEFPDGDLPIIEQACKAQMALLRNCSRP